MRTIAILATVFLLGSIGVAQEEVKEPEAGNEVDCLIGEYAPGMEVDTRSGTFKTATPEVYEPDEFCYLDLSANGPYTQFLEIDGRSNVVAVIREFKGDDVLAVLAALEEKYGEPVADMSLMPDVETKHKVFSASATTKSRILWHDNVCGHDIQFIKQSKIKAWGKGKVKGAVIVTAHTADAATGESVLID